MASPTGGRWIFSVDTTSGFTGVNLGINNGVAPVFPLPVPGKFNIEVFTNPTVAGQAGIPAPDAGFQASITDPLPTTVAPIDNNGFLVGTSLRLSNGDFLAVDSVTGSSLQSGSKIQLGSGKQTVVGAKFDTLVGGSGNQILSALLGNETVIGGTGNESIWGGANDSIVAGTGANQQIVVTGTGTTVVAGLSGNAVVALSNQNTVTSLPGSTQNVIIAAGTNNFINLTGNAAAAASAVIGNFGTTVIGGSGLTNVEGSAGGMQVNVGLGGTTALSGSTNVAAGNTVIGGGSTGNFNYNPGATAGKGDLINLSNAAGTAQINAFAFGATRVASADTILATNNADSIFGGDGDRIGTGNGSVVGGLHQWTHADTVAGSAVGFGSNDTVNSTTYDLVANKAVRNPTVAGTSSAQVTVGSFNTATDFLFYQGENPGTTANIIATSQATLVGVTPSTIITLPDGTVMTLVGITQAQLTPALFKP
jgi:hypothetical protein